jgi:hypothetical protein
MGDGKFQWRVNIFIPNSDPKHEHFLRHFKKDKGFFTVIVIYTINIVFLSLSIQT